MVSELTSMMNTGLSLTSVDPTELMTTSPTNQTTGSSVTSSSSLDGSFYFQCAVVVIGVVGAAANGFILYAMVASKQHKKHILIFNQNLLDFATCIFLSASYLANLANTNLERAGGYWLCLTLLSDGPGWSTFLGSLINLAAITIERYLKVVHPALAKKKLRKWMIYSAATFAWIGGTAVAASVTITTSNVVNGICYALIFWKSRTVQMAFGIWYFLSFFVIILLIFIFFYWRILVAIRHQAKVMAAHGASGSSTAPQSRSKQIQTSIIKTMMLVSVIFVITWAPAMIYYLMLNIYSKFTIRYSAFYAALFIGHFYLCINPFIYTVNFDPVRQVVIGLITRKKTSQAPERIEMP